MRRFHAAFWTPLLAAVSLSVATLAGCGSSPNAAPPITISLSEASITVQAGTTTQFTATLQNDTQNRGVTWSVTGSGCTGAACGTVSPANTLSGAATTYAAPANLPNPATVTLTAIAAADDSKSASATIALIPAPTGVSVAPTAVGIQVASTQQFSATVSPATANQSVTWTLTGTGCTGAACGALSSTTANPVTYTAPTTLPNPASVTITATAAGNPTVQASGTITITTPPTPTGVSVSPTAADIQILGRRPFTATVSPATANQSVAWTLSGTGCTGAACGTLSSTTARLTFYTAPRTVPSPASVTITAAAAGNPTVQGSGTITITLPPIVVDARPPIAPVPVNATQPFIAGVTLDPLNQGVTWTLTGAGCSGVACGTISTTQTASLRYTFYTAPPSVPSPPTVTLTATSVTNPGSSGSATITIIPANNALMNGRYAFLFNAFDSGGQVAIAGSFNADGAGNITGGVEDINRANFTTGTTPLSFTGTYIIGTNNKGQMTLTSSQGSATFHFVIVSSGSKASFIEYDDTTGTGTRGSGSMQKQDLTAFSLAQTNGDFVMGLFGDLPGVGRTGLVGRFNSTSAGAVSGAVMDMTITGTSFPNLNWAGSVAAPDSTTGRGTMTIDVTVPAPGPGAITLNLAYYIIATNKLFVVGTDARSNAKPLLSGQVHGQNIPGGGFTNASLNGNVIFALEGSQPIASVTTVGQVSLTPGNPVGSLTGILDQNDAGTSITLNAPFTGTYTVSSNGRATMTFQLDPLNVKPQVLYVENTDKGFILEASGSRVGIGEFQPQAAGPFSAASLSGTFGENTGPSVFSDYQNHNGLLVLDGISSFGLTTDTSDTIQFLRTKIRGGTYAVSSNGRGTISFATGEEVAFWIISPDEFIWVFTVTPGDFGPALLDCFKL